MGAEFDGKKINVVGGNSGKGQSAALDVIDRGGRHSRHLIPGPRWNPHRRGQRHHLSALRSMDLDHRHDLNVDGGIMAGRRN
jgi:ribosomal protein S6E (S10)